jgi:hypothetical protein
MTKSPSVTIETTSTDMFIVFDGKRIAKRGRPGTKQAGTWVPLEPGYMVRDVEEGIEIESTARAYCTESLVTFERGSTRLSAASRTSGIYAMCLTAVRRSQSLRSANSNRWPL